MARVMDVTAENGRERMILSGIAALVLGALAWALLTWAIQDPTKLTGGANIRSKETAVPATRVGKSVIVEPLRAQHSYSVPANTVEPLRAQHSYSVPVDTVEPLRAQHSYAPKSSRDIEFVRAANQ